MPKKIVDYKQPKPHYHANTRGLAREAQVLEDLLWRKIMATATPEIKELLLTRNGLSNLTEDILEATGPREFYPSPEVAHQVLLEEFQKAQSLLIDTAPRLPEPAQTLPGSGPGRAGRVGQA